jgi:hypothetical protein
MWIDAIPDTGCVTFNLPCVFVVLDRSSTALSFGRFRSLCSYILFLHLRFDGNLASFLCGFSHVRFVIN